MTQGRQRVSSFCIVEAGVVDLVFPVASGSDRLSLAWPSGGIGRRTGLKIPYRVTGVRVRAPSRPRCF